MGVLKVAASPVQMETVFSTFLHEFTQRYPAVQVKLREAAGTNTLALIERGEIHLGISLLQSMQTDDRLFGIFQCRRSNYLQCVIRTSNSDAAALLISLASQRIRCCCSTPVL